MRTATTADTDMSKKAGSGPEEGQEVDLGEVYTRTELFLEKNKKALTIGVGALVVVVGGLFGYRKFVAEPRARTASELMWKAEYYFEVDSLTKALEGDGEWPGFLLIASEYGGTPSGKLAHFHLGAIHMRQGDYELAAAHYEKASVKDDVLRAMAVGGIGDAYVELGREAEAVKRFEKAADMTVNEFTTPMYLMKAGLLHKKAGNWKGAAKVFSRLAREFPNHTDAAQARKYAGLAEAMGG